MILNQTDSSGNMFNLYSAIGRFSEHQAYHICLNSIPPYNFPYQYLINENISLIEAQNLIYECDAVIFKEYSDIPPRYGLDMSKLKDKKSIVLFGGVGFRSLNHRHASYNAYSELNPVYATTSLDFKAESPELEWIPPLIRFDELRGKHDFSKDKTPLICASPSKGTNMLTNAKNLFLATTKDLRERGYDFNSNFIFGVNNEECLRRKAKADIFLDRVWSIYGINSQEAGAFESAVVAGCSGKVLDLLSRYGFTCPFRIVSNLNEVEDAFIDLLEDADYRRELGDACMKYVKKLHNGEESVRRLLKIIG